MISFIWQGEKDLENKESQWYFHCLRGYENIMSNVMLCSIKVEL